MRTLIAMLMLATSIGAPARADDRDLSRIRTQPEYALECEHLAGRIFRSRGEISGYHRVVLHVIPAEFIVRMIYTEGKPSSSLPITRAAVFTGNSYNRFGNLVPVSWIAELQFEDSKGTIGIIRNGQGGYVSQYTVRAGDYAFSYSCVPMATE
jgi:hypothetical protein